MLRHVAFIVGALALLGAALPGTRVTPGRFSASPGAPMPRAGRVGLLVLGLAALGLGLTCGRPQGAARMPAPPGGAVTASGLGPLFTDIAVWYAADRMSTC